MHKLAQGTLPLQALLLYGSPTVSQMSMLIIHLINLIKQLFIFLFPTYIAYDLILIVILKLWK